MWNLQNPNTQSKVLNKLTHQLCQQKKQFADSIFFIILSTYLSWFVQELKFNSFKEENKDQLSVCRLFAKNIPQIFYLRVLTPLLHLPYYLLKTDHCLPFVFLPSCWHGSTSGVASRWSAPWGCLLMEAWVMVKADSGVVCESVPFL